MKIKKNGKYVEISLNELEGPTRVDPKPVQIAEGLFNLMYKPKYLEVLSQERLKFCYVCPIAIKIAGQLVCSSKKTVTEKDNTVVRGCGCVLNVKTRSPKASCPRKLWGAVDADKFKKLYG